MRLLCRMGMHHFRGWVAHTNGPCVFEHTEAHIFRYCMRCRKGQHLFATIHNDPVKEKVNAEADQGNRG